MHGCNCCIDDVFGGHILHILPSWPQKNNTLREFRKENKGGGGGGGGKPGKIRKKIFFFSI